MAGSARGEAAHLASGVKTFWCRSCGKGRNFGDQLTPALLAWRGIPCEWAAPGQAELIAVGSVISRLPSHGWKGTVWGTGTIQADISRDLRSARVLAIRGELTRKACRLPAYTQLGDPGILVPLLFPDVQRAVRRGLILVPHYVDDLMRRRHPAAPVVDILAGHRHVVEQIAQAELVITSSLHAMIAADALGVPHIVEPHEQVKGGMWKFTDYASAFGSSVMPGQARLSDRNLMKERQAQLLAGLDSLVRRPRMMIVR